MISYLQSILEFKSNRPKRKGTVEKYCQRISTKNRMSFKPIYFQNQGDILTEMIQNFSLMAIVIYNKICNECLKGDHFP